MARGGTGPDFIESLARGLELIKAFQPHRPVMTLSEVAAATGWPGRPPAGSCSPSRSSATSGPGRGGFALTPRTLELGMAYVLSQGLWDVAQPHMHALVSRTGESSSLAQLDGSDIVYVARATVPKIIAIQVTVGTRFPALPTSLGKVLLAALPPDRLAEVLAMPSRSGSRAAVAPGAARRSRPCCATSAPRGGR